MDSNQVLVALIARIEASDKSVSHASVFAWDEAQQWNDGVLERFIALGLLTKDVNASSLICLSCEHHCFMEILLAKDESERAFIVCDHADMQSQMGRINVPPERLQQWQSSAKHLPVVLAGLLGFDAKPKYQKEPANYPLGILKGSKRRCWVTLQTNLLSLEINRHVVSLSDLLYFDGDVLLIDEARVDAMVNTEPKESGKQYKPNISKQAARKLATQAMYQDWNDEYLLLQQQNPNKSDTWCSVQIAKMSIAQGKDSETIRKNMKS